MHYLALPFLAGLDEVERTEPAEICRLNESRMRKALAFYYCTAVHSGNDATWYLKLLDASPRSGGRSASRVLQCRRSVGAKRSFQI